MKNLIGAILLCHSTYCLSQTTHSVTVAMNQPPVCNVVSVQKNPPEQHPIFPNPANDVINISGFEDQIIVEFYDALGRNVFSNTYAYEKNITIDVRNYRRGMYRIVLRSRNETRHSRIILE